MVEENLNLDPAYWNSRYINNTHGWDIGAPSPPLIEIIDAIDDKNAAILIPGAGNAYEATYLLNQGFTNIHVIDFAPKAIENINQIHGDNKNLHLYCEDFFLHHGAYDYILEQTFFCALDPSLRYSYLSKMSELLNTKGILTGVLFDKEFDDGPPFSGDESLYKNLFASFFIIESLTPCLNSITPRAGTELLFRCRKK